MSEPIVQKMFRWMAYEASTQRMELDGLFTANDLRVIAGWLENGKKNVVFIDLPLSPMKAGSRTENVPFACHRAEDESNGMSVEDWCNENSIAGVPEHQACHDLALAIRQGRVKV